MKECSSCHIPKDISEFQLDPRYTGGHKGQCRKCINARSAIRSARYRLELIKNKPKCSRKGCINQIPKFRNKYCSIECTSLLKESNSKEQWQKQKIDPEYRKYHVEKARAYQKRQKALGNCVICGKKSVLNKKGLPSVYCEYHKIQANLRSKNNHKNDNPIKHQYKFK